MLMPCPCHIHIASGHHRSICFALYLHRGLFPIQKALVSRGSSFSLVVLVGEALSRMIIVDGNANLISGFKSKPNGPTVNHLQMTPTPSVEPLRIRLTTDNKATLLYFEVVSPLKVNFFKSEIIGVKVEDCCLNGLANLLTCKVSFQAATYLGLHLCLCNF